MRLIDKIYELIPGCAITQDMIAGFPTETEQDHQDSLSLMDYVKYDFGYMYAYSERPGTLAARKMEDDVPEETKIRRLMEIVERQREHSLIRSREYVGQIVEVLVDKTSKKSENDFSGRNTQNVTVVFPRENYKIGDFVNVLVTDCTSGTLIGKAIGYSEMN
jgi:tRNA-2-methylthio-N6-dimethylallyladenosine synthase